MDRFCPDHPACMAPLAGSLCIPRGLGGMISGFQGFAADGHAAPRVPDTPSAS